MRTDGVIAEPGSARRPLALLVVGAATGIVLAATGLLGSAEHRGTVLPTGAVARVNGVVIRAEDYQRAVDGVLNDRRDPLADTQLRQVLDQLINEELLVQRGLDLGLPHHDRKVRADLTAAMIASIVSETEDVQPTDSQLAEFYDQHRDFFSSPGRLRVRQIFCPSPTLDDAPAAHARASEASRRLRAGEPFATVRDALGGPEVSPLPDALLPPAKLVDYIGPTALHAALELGSGEATDPVQSSSGFYVLQVVERQADSTPALADIKPQVLAEWRRRAGDQALREYLDDLRTRAEIVVVPRLQ